MRKRPHRFGAVVSVLATAVIPGACPGADEAVLFDLFARGRLDSLTRLTADLPDSSAAGEFFKGVFQPDGEQARYHYDRVVAFWPGTAAEGWALDRLSQYHLARGDLAGALKYRNFLKARHPSHPALAGTPDLAELPEPPLQAAAADAREGGKPWAVQVGAYQDPRGARKIAQEMSKFGQVRQVQRQTDRGKVTAVLVGRCRTRAEADSLAKSIHRQTGRGVLVVPWE